MVSDDLVSPVIVHSANRIVYANDAFCSLIGVTSPDPVVGEPVTEFVAESDRDPLVDQFDRIAHQQTPALGLQIELATNGGDGREAITVSSPIEWDGDARIHTSFIDVSETEQWPVTALQEQAMNEAPVGVTIADASRDDEPLVYVNDGFVELTGYPREEIIGRNCRFLQGADTRDEPVAEMRQAIDDGRPVSVELRNYRKDGTMFWHSVTIVPVTDDAGDVTHFFGYQVDITDQKVSEHEKSLFERHAEASGNAMFVTDREGTIEYVNPAFERITGYSAAEAIGSTPRLLNSGDQEEGFYDDLWETITAGEIWESEITNQTKTGERYDVEVTIVPITDDRDEITHFTAIARPITDEQLTNQVLTVLNRVLRHNLRTSITVIDGYAAMLEEGLDDEELRSTVQQIRDEVTALEKASEKITPIRDSILSTRESHSAPITILSEIVQDCQERYDGVTITLSMDGPNRPELHHANVLRLAVEEAIENAVVHSDEETPTVTVTVSWTADESEATIEVADTGPGIPDEEWEVIETGSESPLLHSSGIGLWIMYWAMTAMGGSMELRANEPRGSVLTFRVPLSKE